MKNSRMVVPEDPKYRFNGKDMPKFKTYEDDRIRIKSVSVILRAKKKMIKVFDDIVDIFDQEIIKHQIFNETYHQYVDDVSIK